MTLYEFKIGTLAGGVAGMTNLESLTAPVDPPRWFFYPGSERVVLASGLVRDVGYPRAEWHWDEFIPRVQRHQLRTFCTGASVEVYIRTKTNDDASDSGEEEDYANYKAVMVWPEGEEVDAGRRTGFVIQFTHLEYQAPA